MRSLSVTANGVVVEKRCSDPPLSSLPRKVLLNGKVKTEYLLYKCSTSHHITCPKPILYRHFIGFAWGIGMEAYSDISGCDDEVNTYRVLIMCWTLGTKDAMEG